MDRPSRRLGRLELEALRSDPRLAIEEAGIVCLACGRRLRQLTNTHLARHGLSADRYKRRYGYNVGRALMCDALRRVYQARARRERAAERLRRRPFRDDPGLAALAARRAIRLEERLNRSRAASS